MKAILIVDIPEDYIGSEIDINLYCKDRNVIHEKCINKLKLMPRMKGITESMVFDQQYENLLNYHSGWNDCLNDILREE